MNDFLNGAITGIISRLLTAPLDVIKIRMELDSQKSRSLKKVVQTILKEEGVRGLFKGNMAGIYYYMAYNGVQFAVYEKLKSGGVPQFLRGFLSSLVAVCITYPLDIIRTRMTIRANDFFYGTSLRTAINILKIEKNLFKGIMPSILQIAPGMGVSFAVYESLEKKRSPIVAGIMAGFLSRTVVMPFDVIRKRLQIQGSDYENYKMSNLKKYSSLRDCVVRMWREEGGWRAFFKGYIPAIIKSIPTASITFLCYHAIKNFEKNSKSNPKGKGREG